MKHPVTVRTANKRNHILKFLHFFFFLFGDGLEKNTTFLLSLGAPLSCVALKLSWYSAPEHRHWHTTTQRNTSQRNDDSNTVLMFHFHLQSIIHSPRWAAPALVSALIRVPPSRHWLRIIATRSELNNRVGKQSLIQSNDAIRGTWHAAIPL